MAAQTGNTYISGTVIDIFRILTANLTFTTTASSKTELNSSICTNGYSKSQNHWTMFNINNIEQAWTTKALQTDRQTDKQTVTQQYTQLLKCLTGTTQVSWY